MHYRVRGLVVRTENAAKSASEAAQPLIDWILANAEGRCLDYGCGRLRYSSYLARRSTALGMVDSQHQLDRACVLDGKPTTVRDEARRLWPKCRIYTVSEFWLGVREHYDLVLCANVLSAIPSSRVRSKSLRAIRSCLSRDGRVLIVNQHTNSYFTKVRQSPQSTSYGDGWLLRSAKGTAYFGILTTAKVATILKRHGFDVTESWIEGQSNYTLAKRSP